MNSPLSFEQKVSQLAAEEGLKNCFNKGWFNICGLDSAAEALGIDRSKMGKHADYITLEKLHCIDWKRMDPAMRAEVKNKVYSLLGLSLEPQIIDGQVREVLIPPKLLATPVSSDSPKTRWWNR